MIAATGLAHAGSAASGLADQFDDHSLIMIGESHRNVQQHAFLRELIRDPVFACRLDDIVIEFGNSRLQNVADAWTAGRDVSEADLQSMWRETEVPFVWNSPVYREFYEAVRAVNRDHVCAHPLRLVLAGPPIDWARVKTVKDFIPYADRDAWFVQIVEREVLARHHHALLIAGELHALRALPEPEGGSYEGPNVAQTFARTHPGELFLVAPVTTADAAREWKLLPPPSFRAVHGSELEDADFGLIAPAWTVKPVVVNGRHEWQLGQARLWPTMGKVVDGVLWLGGDKTRAFPSPKIYLDPVYQQQIRARAAIIKAFNGQDFGPVRDDLIRDAKAEN